MNPNDTWQVVLPIKSFDKAKQRLREDDDFKAVGGVERIARSLCFGTLQVLESAPYIAKVQVVTSIDPSIFKGFQKVRTVSDLGVTGLNHAVKRGLVDLAGGSLVNPEGVFFPSKTIVLHADLPILQLSDIAEVLDQVQELQADVAISDSLGTGTTALISWEGGCRQLNFGPGSYNKHLAAGFMPLDLPTYHGMRADLDTREQLAKYQQKFPDKINALLSRSVRYYDN